MLLSHKEEEDDDEQKCNLDMENCFSSCVPWVDLYMVLVANQNLQEFMDSRAKQNAQLYIFQGTRYAWEH